MQNYLNGIVSIRSTTSSSKDERGTGFIVSRFKDDYYIATANHVVNNSNQINVYFDQTVTPVKAEIVQQSDDQDIALIKVPANNFDWQPRSYLVASRPNDPVWFSIQQSGTRKILPVYGAQDQTISSVTTDKILAQLSGVDKGCSGGPLIGRQGIIGMIFEVRDGGTTISRPIDLVRRMVKKEWDEKWDLSAAERPELDNEKQETYSPEQSIPLAGVHATFGDGGANRLIDGNIDSYWQSQSARNDGSSSKVAITLLLAKSALVTAIDVYVPNDTKGRYLNLVDEVQSMLVGSARALFDNGESRRILYQVKSSERNGKWYTCRFESPTQLVKKLTLQLTPSVTNCSNCLNRYHAYVHEVRIYGRPLEEKTNGETKVEQISLSNAAIRLNGNAQSGSYLKDGNTNHGVYLNLKENNQTSLPEIDVELSKTNAITHIRLFNPKDGHQGTVNVIQPYYDGIPGREIVFDGRTGWDQAALESGRQARSIKLVVKKGWDPVGSQQTLQLNEIQLLGHELVQSTLSKIAFTPYPLAGAQASSNTIYAYRMVNNETNDGWTNEREDDIQGSKFDVFITQPVLVEAVRLFNQENELSIRQVLVEFSSGGSERLIFRGIPGWEEIQLQRPVRTDIVRFTIEDLNAPERKRGRFYIREIQLLGKERIATPFTGAATKPQSITASSQLNDYWQPQRAVDNELQSAWAPANSNSYEPWLQATFSTDINLTRFSIANQTDGNPVTQLTIQFSDGSSERVQLKGFNKIPEMIKLQRPHRTRWAKLLFEKWLPGHHEPLFRINELNFYTN